MSRVNSFRATKFLATLSALVVAAGMLIGARVAVADSVWVQSYQRESADEACEAQPDETPWQASWGADASWKPSWEQWANNGKGGWVCTRSITWARDSVARTYALGDIGPGGGLVFLISGGKTYEMAPKTWSGAGTPDATTRWCANSDITGAVGTAVGTGSANTTAMQPAVSVCTTGDAGVSARAYRGGGFTDWFLPSKDELNAMCNYSRIPTAPAAPSVSCYGTGGTTPDTAFAASSYGFEFAGAYWSSSQTGESYAWYQVLAFGLQDGDGKGNTQRVRPIRAF